MVMAIMNVRMVALVNTLVNLKMNVSLVISQMIA